jgi:diguanylate cyclase (GGDEF)-like protein/PAS domain S-box-containing protein
MTVPGEGETGDAGNARDLTTEQLAAAEQRFHTLVRSNRDIIAVVDRSGHLVYTNPAFERLLGFSKAQQAGLDMFSVVHPDDGHRARAAFDLTLSQPGSHPPSVYRFRTATGGWLFIEVVSTNCLDDPAIEGIVLNCRDVTEATFLTRALRTLGQGNQVLVKASDEASLLQDTCRMVVEAGGYLLAWVGYAERDEARTVRVVASAGCTGYLDGLRAGWGDDVPGRGPMGKAIRSGVVQVVKDTHRSTSFRPWRAAADLWGFRTACALPLVVGGKTLGILVIYAAVPGAFDPASVDLLGQLAHNMAYGIGRLRDASSLQAIEERFRVLADAAPVGILESLPGGGVNYANPRAAEICGTEIASLMGRGWIDAVHPDDLAGMIAFAERIRVKRRAATSRFRVLRPDGEVRHVRFVAAPKGARRDNGHVATMEDVTEEVRAQEELARQAFYDALTGLANRNLFLDRLSQELATRTRGRPGVAVLFLDLDRFQVVNDSLGHEAGDEVLRQTAARLRQAVRAGETVARFGGDEFVFIIRDVHQVADAVRVARRLLEVLHVPLSLNGHDLTVTGSMGVVVPRDHADATTVLRDADTAMNRAKETGRDRYEVFGEDLHNRSVRRLAIESDLRHALARGQFELYYQPGVWLPSGDPMGAEALIRWHHPERGMVSPLDFIPIAEDSGLITAIGAWVFEQAVSQLAVWDGLAEGPRVEVMAINLSVRQLDDDATAGIISDVLDRHGIAPGRVNLEVTESAVMSDSTSTKRALESFRSLGLRISIDDFGTGYSSLSYLHTLPVTTVKIDRSFVERMGSAEDARPVVQAVIDMAHAMGLRVVAEGTSSARLSELVSEMGADVAQGFYWARPMPAREIPRWWTDAVRKATLLASVL